MRALFPQSVKLLVVGGGFVLGLMDRTFFWLGSDVLSVFPLFRDNFFRPFQLKGEASPYNYLN